jgi:hypothetical protein
LNISISLAHTSGTDVDSQNSIYGLTHRHIYVRALRFDLDVRFGGVIVAGP